MILYLSSGPPDVSVTQFSLFWFLWPTWSGIQFNIFRTVVPITTKQELLSAKCSMSAHAHMHTHICACAHTRAHSTHTCIHTHIHTHVYSLIDTYMHSEHSHVYTRMHSPTHVLTHVHTCAYAQLYTCVHTHMHKSTCIHTHACPGLFLHIHRKHRVRTDKHHQNKGRIKTIYGHFWFSAKAGICPLAEEGSVGLIHQKGRV